jgi:hypothetical protein
MRDSNVANPAKESAQAEFPHGLLDFGPYRSLVAHRRAKRDDRAGVEKAKFGASMYSASRSTRSTLLLSIDVFSIFCETFGQIGSARAYHSTETHGVKTEFDAIAGETGDRN